jgi:hypothetical protein
MTSPLRRLAVLLFPSGANLDLFLLMEKLEEEEDALLRPVLEQLSDGGAAIMARLHDVRRRRRLLVQQQYPEVDQKREEEGALQLGPTAVELPPELWLRILDFVEPRERVCSAALVCRQWR